jgi:hypothetical protein
MTNRHRSHNQNQVWYCKECKFPTPHRALVAAEQPWDRFDTSHGIYRKVTARRCTVCGGRRIENGKLVGSNLTTVTMYEDEFFEVIKQRDDFEKKIREQQDAFEKHLRELQELISKSTQIVSK